jgi:hypothetical protein
VGARISAPVQTGLGAYPTSYTMGTGSFPGVKRPGRGLDHPPTSSAEVKETVVLLLWTFVACSRVNFTFNLYVAFRAKRILRESALHAEHTFA